VGGGDDINGGERDLDDVFDGGGGDNSLIRVRFLLRGRFTGDNLLDDEPEFGDADRDLGNGTSVGVLGEAVGDELNVEGFELLGVNGGSRLPIGL